MAQLPIFVRRLGWVPTGRSSRHFEGSWSEALLVDPELCTRRIGPKLAFQNISSPPIPILGPPLVLTLDVTVAGDRSNGATPAMSAHRHCLHPVQKGVPDVNGSSANGPNGTVGAAQRSTVHPGHLSLSLSQGSECTRKGSSTHPSVV